MVIIEVAPAGLRYSFLKCMHSNLTFFHEAIRGHSRTRIPVLISIGALMLAELLPRKNSDCCREKFITLSARTQMARALKTSRAPRMATDAVPLPILAACIYKRVRSSIQYKRNQKAIERARVNRESVNPIILSLLAARERPSRASEPTMPTAARTQE